MANNKKPWSGRFRKATAKSVEKFTSSIDFDKRLYPYDIEGSIAHATMLAKQKIISSRESAKIVSALKTILNDIEKGKFKFISADEDIHMAVEKELIRRIGDVGENFIRQEAATTRLFWMSGFFYELKLK